MIYSSVNYVQAYWVCCHHGNNYWSFDLWELCHYSDYSGDGIGDVWWPLPIILSQLWLAGIHWLMIYDGFIMLCDSERQHSMNDILYHQNGSYSCNDLGDLHTSSCVLWIIGAMTRNCSLNVSFDRGSIRICMHTSYHNLPRDENFATGIYQIYNYAYIWGYSI